MDVSEEQKRRMEANRAAALARRNAKQQQHVCDYSSKYVGLTLSHQLPVPHLNLGSEISKLSDSTGFQAQSGLGFVNKEVDIPKNVECQVLISKGPSDSANPSIRNPNVVPQQSVHCERWENRMGTDQLYNGCHRPSKVDVILEICAPTKFVVKMKTALGDQNVCQEFFQNISSVSKCNYVEYSKQCSVYSLKDYNKVTKALKRMQRVQYEPIPWPTRMVLEKLLNINECQVPYRARHVTDTEVEELLTKLPLKLKNNLLPFQREGVVYSLQRSGRCLLADEMGVGKTIQAIAMAACYREEGPLLVVCPASMRLVWAEELERWLPFLSPLDVHLVFGRRNDLAHNVQLPKVVVISYFMLARLQQSMLSHKWGMLIVDESHNLRCTSRKVESDETIAVLELARNVKRVVLLTGTPSLSRPFDIFNQVNCLWPDLLGKSKYEFARNYCDHQSRPFRHENFKGFARGTRLQELNVLLKQTVMIRRLKEDVMAQLPPKRRQVICLKLAPVDIQDAKAFTATTVALRNSALMGKEACKCGFARKGTCDCEEETEDELTDDSMVIENQGPCGSTARSLGNQEIGVAKLRGFREWLLNNSIFASQESTEASTQEKMIIFAHHHKVLDEVQAIVQSKSVELVRVDGTTLAQERLKNVNRFQLDPEVKVAIIGVTAGGVGLNFSAAQSVVFVELPKSASEMLQAEDRAHRRGQKNAVNIYIFCAKGTSDETHWQSLSRSLEHVSTMTDGVEASLEVYSVTDSTVPCIQESTVKSSCVDTDVSGQADGNASTGTEETSITNAIEYESEDSCMTSKATDSVDHYEGNPQNQTPSLECRMSKVPSGLGHGVLETLHSKDEKNGQKNSSVDFPANFLMFEVSSNTGRIHLFLKSSNAITSLQENFKPEDLTHFREIGTCKQGALPTCLADSISHREVATNFLEQWNSLRPVFRKKLLGRPLLLPLSAELSCVKIEGQYASGGIAKGGSKRRYTPREEVGCAPPDGATWKTISFHKRTGLKESQVLQAWSVGGCPLCKFCQSPCEGYRSKKPQSFEDLFCKIDCYDAYANKTSGRHIREELFNLEGGVCVKCGLDCHALVERMRPLPLDQRRAYILEKAPQFVKRKQMLERLIKDPTEGNAWHGDHIVAVADGGGECNLENMQTLCVVCHAQVTAEQQHRRRSSQLRAKNGLQMTIKKLLERSQQSNQMHMCLTEVGAPLEESVENSLGHCPSYLSSSEDDKELLDTEVAGSAYSASTANACTRQTKESDLKVQGHNILVENVESEKYAHDPFSTDVDDHHPPKGYGTDIINKGRSLIGESEASRGLMTRAWNVSEDH